MDKQKNMLSWWAIVLIILGSPIWASLLISLFAVIFSVYVSLWSVAFSLWAVFVSLLVLGVALTAACFIFVFCGKGLTGLASFAAGLICVGLGIFTFFVCKAATKGMIILHKIAVNSLKKCFIKKGGGAE